MSTNVWWTMVTVDSRIIFYVLTWGGVLSLGIVLGILSASGFIQEHPILMGSAVSALFFSLYAFQLLNFKGERQTVIKNSTSFKFAIFILVFFYLIPHIKILVEIVTNNELVAAIIGDIVIAGLVFFYVTYVLAGSSVSVRSRFDGVKLTLWIVLILVLFQSSCLALILSGNFASVMYQATYSFRKVFFPLTLFFLLSYLIKNELKRNGENLFPSLVKIFKAFLLVAITFNIVESALRTLVPEFNSFYLQHYVYNRILTPASPTVFKMDDYPIQILRYMGGPSVARTYGISQEMYVSGHMIFLCYLFYFFMSGKLKLVSILNGSVLVALLLSGSRTYIFPFLLLNGFLMWKRYGRGNILAQVLVGLVAAFGLVLVVDLMRPAFNEQGYFTFLFKAIDPAMTNWSIFILGSGPIGFTPWGEAISWIGDVKYEVHHKLQSFGFLEITFETGLYMSFLFVLFHYSVFRMERKSGGHDQHKDQYIKNLKILIVINMFVGLAHWPTLFDETIIIFHVFLIALLYSWSRFSAESMKVRPSSHVLGEPT